MARFRCRDCGYDGECDGSDMKLECPSCGSSNGQMALGVAEFSDDTWARLLERMQPFMDEHDDGTEVELIYGPDVDPAERSSR